MEIIAELAQGYNGCEHIAKTFVSAAQAAGADAVKFQLVYADELATQDYQYYQLFKSLEMPKETWLSIKQQCVKSDLKLYLDIFGKDSLALAELLKVDGIKLHATDLNNVYLLQLIAESNVEKVLLGAGGGYQDEIELALDILTDKEVVLLHGFQGYPTANADNHISRLNILKKISLAKNKNKITLGFADHSEPESILSTTTSALAYGLGVRVFEKHLTIAKVMKMEDYESALNPDEFSLYVTALRDVAQAYGDIDYVESRNDFAMSDSEKNYRNVTRRHVVANKSLPAGQVLSMSDLEFKRTSHKNAITEMKFCDGKKLSQELSVGSVLTEDSLAIVE